MPNQQLPVLLTYSSSLVNPITKVSFLRLQAFLLNRVLIMVAFPPLSVLFGFILLIAALEILITRSNLKLMEALHLQLFAS